MDIKQKVKELPLCPGVYLMKDSLGNIIYVGKSKNLKNRVGSYFQNSKAHSPKVIKLVNNLKDFDYIITDTEFEAFLLENKLIKELQPVYNKLMKNPKSYSYIKINLDEKYPTIEVSGESEETGEKLCFGPYTSRNTVERGLQGIRELFGILCTNVSRKSTPCLNHSLGLCIGACMENTPREHYINMVNKTIGLLDGTDKSIIEAIESKMNIASEELYFEKAARYRDYLSAVKYLTGKVKVVEYTKENRNIAVLENLNEDTVKLFLIKGNKVLFNEKCVMKDLRLEEQKLLLKANILSCFSTNILNTPREIKKEEIDDSQIIYSYIKNRSGNCRHIVVRDKWLKEPDHTRLDNAIDKLLALNSR